MLLFYVICCFRVINDGWMDRLYVVGVSCTQHTWYGILQGPEGPAGVKGDKGDNGASGDTGPIVSTP